MRVSQHCRPRNPWVWLCCLKIVVDSMGYKRQQDRALLGTNMFTKQKNQNRWCRKPKKQNGWCPWKKIHSFGWNHKALVVSPSNIGEHDFMPLYTSPLCGPLLLCKSPYNHHGFWGVSGGRDCASSSKDFSACSIFTYIYHSYHIMCNGQ